VARITIDGGLAFVEVALHANGKILNLSHVLLDTGSGGTVFRADDLELMGVVPDPEGIVQTMGGIGEGTEAVLETRIDGLEVGDLRADQFVIQMGELQYHRDLDGIIGIGFLLQTNAVIDFRALTITRAT
jgi:hypothetical protein